MKYYLCIKDDNTYGNDFLKELFMKRYDSYLNGTYYNYTDRYGIGRGYRHSDDNYHTFSKGQIYRTVSYSDDYVKDDYGNSFKVIGLTNILMEFNFELDEDTKQMIKAKEDKGDTIQVEPYRYNEITNETIYRITCTSKQMNVLKAATRIDSSPVQGIIDCYKEIRMFNLTCIRVKNAFKGSLLKNVKRFGF
jgi:hypothetical protein